MTTRRAFLWQLGAMVPASAAVSIMPDRPTVLMGDAAHLAGGLRARPADHGAKRFHVSNWQTSEDAFEWRVNIPSAGDFDVVALVKGKTAALTLECAGTQLQHTIDAGWDRLDIGALRLPKGTHTLRLAAPNNPGSGLELYSLELITPSLRRRLLNDAKAMRSDTSWMRRAKYGLQFHWTSRSQPRQGIRKPYAEAVAAFPAAEFARLVNETGAGYVILTTSHAEQFFPAPIRAIDSIMPGRTASRDLVAELIDQLGRYGVRLMLYYHVGHDHWNEPDGWWVRTGYDPAKPAKFLDNWCSIIGEVGKRYGTGLAGWFFDDSCVYYPLNPDFRRLTQTAKTANPGRLVCYNPWIWPRCTDFQDYFCGEGYNFLKVTERLPADGTGIFTGGPQEGLQAHTNFILESDWCHSKADTPIPPPRVPKENFVRDMKDAIARGIVPSVNLEIYQDGGIGEASLDYMRAVKAAVKV